MDDLERLGETLVGLALNDLAAPEGAYRSYLLSYAGVRLAGLREPTVQRFVRSREVRELRPVLRAVAYS